MIKLRSGEEFELLKYNVKFDDNTKEIIVDASLETFWIDSNSIL